MKVEKLVALVILLLAAGIVGGLVFESGVLAQGSSNVFTA